MRTVLAMAVTVYHVPDLGPENAIRNTQLSTLHERAHQTIDFTLVATISIKHRLKWGIGVVGVGGCGKNK